VSQHDSREVGIIVEWQAVDSIWCDHRWRVTEVLPGPAAALPWTVLSETASVRRYFAGNAGLLLFPLETDTLKHNIEGPQPAVYVFLRTTEATPGMALLGATVCAGEAQAHVDTGSDLVESVPMPPEVAAWVAGFVERHHVERVGYKRRRDRSERDGGQRDMQDDGDE
jgi:hypothetical protein